MEYSASESTPGDSPGRWPLAATGAARSAAGADAWRLSTGERIWHRDGTWAALAEAVRTDRP